MKAELEQLIALQKADISLRRIRAELESLPRRRAEIEKEFDQRAFEFKALETQRDEARAKRAQFEKEIAETRTHAEKAERDLMSSTNPKTYEAAIREADAAKKHISELETKILEQMEAAETAEKTIAEREPEIARMRAERDEQLKSLEERVSTDAEALAARREERERMLANLPPVLKSMYSRISARIPGGVAVAEARNNSCTACFITLRPQMMADVRRGEEVIVCDNCARILYYVPAEQQSRQATSTAPVS
ncbi:MAG: C4-type zinc ribbon domain-containing protein [Acidobacteria bacterium]|nr:C4-type zinc ribbon domain-containing protein [Acidobacteriota bacterium]